MYLVDVFRLILAGSDPDRNVPPGAASENVRFFRGLMDTVLDDGTQRVTFASSALAMGADVRIDTPDRLEGLAAAVFAEPRTIFLEAGHRARDSALGAIRGFFRTPLPPGRSDPERVGLLVHAPGDGTALIDVLWTFPRATVRKGMAGWSPGGRTRLERSAAEAVMRTGASLARLRVDLGAGLGLSRADFGARLEAGDRAARAMADMPFIHSRAEEVGAAAGPPGSAGRARAAARVRVTEAWRAFRFSEIAWAEPHPAAAAAAVESAAVSGRDVDAVFEDAKRDLDGEFVFALALLAVWDARAPALERTERPARPPSPRARPVSPRDLPIDPMRVVSLDVSGFSPDMRAALSPEVAEKGGTRARRRHFVRGHLFRARSGHIVWRAGHFRGQGTGSTLTRAR